MPLPRPCHASERRNPRNSPSSFPSFHLARPARPVERPAHAPHSPGTPRTWHGAAGAAAGRERKQWRAIVSHNLNVKLVSAPSGDAPPLRTRTHTHSHTHSRTHTGDRVERVCPSRTPMRAKVLCAPRLVAAGLDAIECLSFPRVSR